MPSSRNTNIQQNLPNLRYGSIDNTQQLPPEPVLPPVVDPRNPARPRPKFHELSCPGAEQLTFWKSVTDADLAYKTPYEDNSMGTKYVTFEPGE